MRYPIHVFALISISLPTSASNVSPQEKDGTGGITNVQIVQPDQMPYDVRLLMVESGAQNLALPELDAKVAKGETLTDREKNVYAKLHPQLSTISSVNLPRGCLLRSSFPPQVSAAVPPLPGRAGLHLYAGSSKAFCDAEPGCQLFKKSEIENFWQARVDGFAYEALFAVAPCSFQ